MLGTHFGVEGVEQKFSVKDHSGNTFILANTLKRFIFYFSTSFFKRKRKLLKITENCYKL